MSLKLTRFAIVAGAMIWPVLVLAAEGINIPAPESHLIRQKSAYSVQETVSRLKADIASKKIVLFDDIDQAALASAAGIKLSPQHLIIFGNPPLGIQFLTSNQYSGLDWPVRMLVLQDANGDVWVAYTDFDEIARRNAITDRDPAFKMASQVAASIASVSQRPSDHADHQAHPSGP